LRMTVKLGNRGGSSISIPVAYNHMVQAFIYQNISSDLADFLHDRGYLYGKRSFKFFTFSRILGSWRRRGNELIFKPPLVLHISSPVDRFITELANTMVSVDEVRLGREKLSVECIEFPPDPEIGTSVMIETLSPITVYSTLYAADGKKKTYYYSPKESEFQVLVEANLKKKAAIFYRRVYRSSICIMPLKRPREVVVIFKGTVVKGWTGSFELRGPKSLLRLAYEVGLGSKNSAGFGMFGLIS